MNFRHRTVDRYDRAGIEPARKPDFVIIGAQKGGSTSLARLLGQHPSVYVAPDEIPYFESPFYERSARSEFDASFTRVPEECQRVGFHRPDYLGSTECPARLRRDLEKIDIFIVLRHPVDRLVSAYYWYVQLGLIPLRPIGDALREWWAAKPGELPPVPRKVLSYSHYRVHIQHWLHFWEPERFIIMANTALSDPQQILWTFQRLGVKPAPDLKVAPRLNEGTYDLQRLRLLRLRRPFVFSWEREVRYTHRARRFRRPAGMPMVALVKVSDRLLAGLRHQCGPKLSHDLLSDLEERYADDCQFVLRQFGVDLGRSTLGLVRD